MEKIIGYCGIVCSECPAFNATLNDDDEARIKTAEIWSKEFHAEIKPEDINCEGCHSENGILFTHCMVCEIRKCGQTKDVANCAYCDDFSCQKVSEFHNMVPEAKKILDALRTN